MKFVFVFLLFFSNINSALASDTSKEKEINENLDDILGTVIRLQKQMEDIKAEFNAYKSLHNDCFKRQADAPPNQAQPITPPPMQPAMRAFHLNFQPYLHAPSGQVLFYAIVNGTLFYDPTKNVQWYQPFDYPNFNAGGLVLHPGAP